MRTQYRGTAHTRRLTCVYAPWPQTEIKEQKTAEAKTEEQETKGTKAEKVCLAPSPSLRYISTRAHTNPPDP